MAINYIQFQAAAATDGVLVAADTMDVGTATGVEVQLIKFGYGTDEVYNAVATGTPLPVLVGTFTATGDVNVATDRTYPVSVATEVILATGSVIDVEVDDVVPGTGATNLGKAIDNVVGSTDTGVAMLGKHQAAGARLTSTDGDYDISRLSEYGAILTEPEQHLVIDDMNALLGFGGTWAAIDTDTTGVAVTTKHVLGTQSIEFDKVDGAANTGIGGITKALDAINLDGASPHDILTCVVQIAAVDDIDDGTSYFFLRLGTDSTDYNEWRIDGTQFTAGIWETVSFEVGDASYSGQGGAGITWSAITYVAIGFQFDAAGDLEPNIAVDEISYHTNQHVNAAINAEITSSVSSANINLHKVGGSPATKGAGNVGAGSQRIVIASDDILLATMATGIASIVSTIDANNVVQVTNAGTATMPVSVGTHTATGTYYIDAAGTATLSVIVNNTATVSLATDNVLDVEVLNTATVAITGNVTAVQATATSLNAIVRINVPRSHTSHGFNSATGTDSTNIATATANAYKDLSAIHVVNGGTANLGIIIKSASTATVWHHELAGDGGGFTLSFPNPIPQAQQATNWIFELDADTSGATPVSVMASFITVT